MKSPPYPGWLHPSVNNCELFPSFHEDLKFTVIKKVWAVGVLLALRHDTLGIIKCGDIDVHFPSIDFLICKCSLFFKHIIVIIIYMSTTRQADFLEMFLNALERLNFYKITQLLYWVILMFQFMLLQSIVINLKKLSILLKT